MREALHDDVKFAEMVKRALAEDDLGMISSSHWIHIDRGYNVNAKLLKFIK